MFVKITEDRRVHEKIANQPSTGLPVGYVPREHVRLSTHWITEMGEMSDNPVNTILFSQLAQGIELQILQKDKKRIFDQGEGIKLAPSTIKEVVKILEHLDLYAVDEDLNGRLFETFLTATMRGEALGQFFTPRSVVKFMVKLARLRSSHTYMDRILDGCCGTGGFLIEAMSDMSATLNNNKTLSATEKERLTKQLRNENLWGIDAGQDPPIARVARLNMLLHKDGGSRIYCADTLDKRLRVEPGLQILTKQEIDELRSYIVDGKLTFSTILTNPPFSMRKEKKNEKEFNVLKDYTLFIDDKGKPRASLKSSVMFLERYWDLLEDDGKLLTIMDDSVLNTGTAQPFREYILSHFTIKLVISLPKNTFVKAQGSVSTSILYLRKKTNPKEPQPVIFMALCNNVGHSDSGKERPHLNQLPQILESYRFFEEHSKLQNKIPAIGFIIYDLLANNPTKRLDAQFFNPRYFTSMDSLEKIAQERKWKVVPLESLLKAGKEALTGGATPLGAAYPDEGAKFIRVQNVRPNRLVWNPEEDHCIDSHTHTVTLKRSQLKKDDVIFTITGSYGIAAVVPENFGEANINQHSVRIRVNDDVLPEYLSVFLNTELCRPQINRAATGSSRLALDYTSVRKLKILLPLDKDEQAKIVKSVMEKLVLSTSLRNQSEQLESQMLQVMS
jgi:type I restriction enzyme M protein